MTTQRLYYDDSYTVRFEAAILETALVNKQPAAVLDKSYFYPTGGGQPCDTGSINSIAVIDVFSRDDDAAIVHVLEKSVSISDKARGEVFWARRFDHMQHHTGQHILTQAFVQVADAKTIGFHLSSDSVTIDLDTTTLTNQVLDQVEDLANQIIWENRPVKVGLREVDDQEGIRIRRLPQHLLTEGLRVIEIENFDKTACGGTHVANTGEIGLIKIVKADKRGTKARVEFRCGSRALQDYREKNRIANVLAAELNCRFTETPQLIENLRQDLKSARVNLKSALTELIEHETNQLIASASPIGEKYVVSAVFENRDPGELKLLASKLVSNPMTIALLGTSGEKPLLLFARSDDLDVDVGKLLRDSLTPLGGRGGGQPNFAQGGIPAADVSRIQAVLEEAAQKL
jgi:alanyl-tRNA synthetase